MAQQVRTAQQTKQSNGDSISPLAGGTSLRVSGVSKTFNSNGRVVEALRPVDLEVEAGELVCFLGPSGCGKSTLLSIIAGLERQTAGKVIQNGRDVSHAPPAARDYGI